MEEMKSTTYRAMATYELGWNVRTKEDAPPNDVGELRASERASCFFRCLVAWFVAWLLGRLGSRYVMLNMLLKDYKVSGRSK